MSLLRQDRLIVERPASFRSALWNIRYRAEAYDDAGRLQATVSERRGPVLLAPVRLTDLTGCTPYRLRVHLPDGVEVLRMQTWFSLYRPTLRVQLPGGAPLGTVRLRKTFSRRLLLHAADGSELCALHEVMSLSVAPIVQRDGRKKRRYTFQLGPAADDVTRPLAIGAALAFDVVSGRGTDL
ncbi:hypothetical protein OG216_46170 (plasmid) [Streptomycetaceae bacterium NBC_01309]